MQRDGKDDRHPSTTDSVCERRALKPIDLVTGEPRTEATQPAQPVEVMMPTTLKVAWVKEGKKRWEDWWVARRGYSLTKIPGLKDHVSFANYDLSRNGCPTLTLGDDVLEIANVTDEQLSTILTILDYHGFQVVSDP